VDLVSRLTLTEKLGRSNGSATSSTPLSNYATALPSVGVGYYQWWSEALHGVASSPGVDFDAPGFESATSFPQVVATSMSFNRSLFRAIGSAVATEARAFANNGHAGLTFWTPNLNLFRDPRWGRGQETPGEDPYLTSEYVQQLVPGLQRDPELDPDGEFLKVSACCKHYAGYSLEQWEGVSRHQFNAEIGTQDFADTYLPAFEACATPAKAGASSMMCSYNAVNGVPSCANDWLLSDLARGEWGFDGYITSDCGAVEDVWLTHHYTDTPVEAVADVLTAGTDLDCGSVFDEHLGEAFDAGAVTEGMLDSALINLAAVQMRLGMFQPDDAPTPFDGLGAEDVATAEHTQLALEAARQAVTMLKNKDATLPLFGVGNEVVPPRMRLAVVGPNANATVVMQGNYQGVAPFLVSPLEGLRQSGAFAEVGYAKGCDVNSSNASGIAAAAELVEVSDAVVLVVGLDQTVESEGLDRYTLPLPGQQMNLVEAVLERTGGAPVVLVVMAGGAVCLGPYADDDRVGAILFVGYPGQSGGQAIADAVTGSLNPAGRLTQTFYKASFVDEVSFFDMAFRPSSHNNNANTTYYSNYSSPGRSYRFYAGENFAYPFGHGLSYSELTYAFEADSSDQNGVMVTVVNKDLSRRASASVLLFLAPPTGGTTTPAGSPLKSLRGFDRVTLAAGASESVSFSLTAVDFSLADEEGSFHLVEGAWTATVAGSNEGDAGVGASFSIDVSSKKFG